MITRRGTRWDRPRRCRVLERNLKVHRELELVARPQPHGAVPSFPSCHRCRRLGGRYVRDRLRPSLPQISFIVFLFDVLRTKRPRPMSILVFVAAGTYCIILIRRRMATREREDGECLATAFHPPPFPPLCLTTNASPHPPGSSRRLCSLHTIRGSASSTHREGCVV